MEIDEKLVSKVLILDNSAEHSQFIKQFCDENHLVGLKVAKNNLMQVLRKNIDLGAILYSDSYGDSLEETTNIALKVHSIRPELPIILRRETAATLADLPKTLQQVFCAVYVANDMSVLRKVLDRYIFSLLYPNALVRGIVEISESVFKNQFKEMEISWDTPYLVRDNIIFGEVFSLIPLESAWCRGYMMLQTEENPFIDILDFSQDPGSGMMPNFRAINGVLSEITNVIWGSFKNRYVGDETRSPFHNIQVPIIVNHQHKYISFGGQDPQLCFCATLTDKKMDCQIKFYMRFIFNLNWAPEDFKELTPDVGGMVDTGELELF